MLVYFVHWSRQDELVRTSKRGPRKTVGSCFSASILCNNLKDAMIAFRWIFDHYFEVEDGISIDDGELRFKRSVLDSRGFTVQFLYFDKMKQPIYLTDPEASILSYSGRMHITR